MPGRRSSDVHARAVGLEIARARRGGALTQRALAARLEVDQSYVAALESGRANPTLGQLAHVAGALGARLQVTLEVPERASVNAPDQPAAS